MGVSPWGTRTHTRTRTAAPCGCPVLLGSGSRLCGAGTTSRAAPASQQGQLLQGWTGWGRGLPPRSRDMACFVLNCLLSLMLSKASGSRVNISHTVIYGCQVGVIADSGIFAACSLSAWQITWCRGAPAQPRPLGTPGDSPGTAQGQQRQWGARPGALPTPWGRRAAAASGAHPGTEPGLPPGSSPGFGFPGAVPPAPGQPAPITMERTPLTSALQPGPALCFQAEAQNSTFLPSAEPSRRHAAGPAAFSTKATRLQRARLRLSGQV